MPCARKLLTSARRSFANAWLFKTSANNPFPSLAVRSNFRVSAIAFCKLSADFFADSIVESALSMTPSNFFEDGKRTRSLVQMFHGGFQMFHVLGSESILIQSRLSAVD